jgi:hypothetical protein
MARFHRTLDLAPVPRAWFESTVSTCWDALTEHLGGPDLPLADGEPLSPGARYEHDGTIVVLGSWARDGESAARVSVVADGSAGTCHLRLDSPAAPRTLTVEGGGGDGRTRSTVTGGGSVDFERWWSGRGPAARGRLRHAIARVECVAGLEPGDRWRVTVGVRVHGRGLYRLLVAPGLLVGGFWLRREFARVLDDVAARWNAGVPGFVALSPDEVRALVTAELARH